MTRLPHIPRKLGLSGLAAAALVAVWAMNGVLPGIQFPSLGIPFLVVAQGESLAKGGLFHYAQHFGHPFGAPVLEGLPIVAVHALLIRCLPLNAFDCYTLTYALFLGAAFGGGIRLLARFGAPPAFSIVGSGVYLCSIFVVGHQQYSSLQIGFALLPASIALDLAVRERLGREGKSLAGLGAWLMGISLWKTGLLFVDGYSFVISAVFSASILTVELWTALRQKHSAELWRAAALLVVPHAIAYIAYVAYIPGARSYGVMPADYLRAQGVDLATWVLPLNRPTALSEWLGLKMRHYTAREFYGDGSNAFSNYLGMTLLLGLPGLGLIWRSQPRLRPVLFAGAVCLVLSLGPSLKIYNLREQGPSSSHPGFGDYLMKPEETTLNFHTERLYLGLPGIQVMRSVYRWQLGFRIVALTGAIALLSGLAGRRHTLVAILLLAVLVVDSVPPVRHRLVRYRQCRAKVLRFFSDIIPEMRAVVRPGGTMLFVSAENDYLANPIAVALDSRCYNVGGDKNLDLASKHWPAEVREIVGGRDIIANALKLHAQGGLDYLVFPNFNLRWDSYAWPPPEKKRVEAQKETDRILGQHPLPCAVSRGRYATILDFSRPASPALTMP